VGHGGIAATTVFKSVAVREGMCAAWDHLRGPMNIRTTEPWAACPWRWPACARRSPPAPREPGTRPPRCRTRIRRPTFRTGLR